MAGAGGRQAGGGGVAGPAPVTSSHLARPGSGDPIDSDDAYARMLFSGGDHRLRLDPITGLSPYRVSPLPRRSVPLGSCTASSPSVDASAAARALYERVGASQDARDHEQIASDHRQRLREVFELTRDTPIALLPSGTDAVYLASVVGLCRADTVHHVVVGANELGGGTLSAARGVGISDVAPFGSAARGASMHGLTERCSAEAIYLRDSLGERLEIEQIDREVEAAVRRASREHMVILHLVAHSKTGLRAPSFDTCTRLMSELGSRLLVMVDGAQGRLAPRDVRRALESGFAVLFTGSKFYSGPPFSCALILPPGVARDPGALPASLRAWFSKTDLPPHWHRARASLAEPFNPGLALRWEAALYEIDAYHGLEPRYRAGAYHTFAGAVHEAFGPSDAIELDVPRPPVHQLVTALGAFPSVFGFAVRGPDGYLNSDQLRVLHALLDTDRGDVHPDLGGTYHLGQPVALGPPGEGRPALLRVALGARLAREHASSADRGGEFFRSTLQSVRRKIEAIVARGEFV